MAKAYVVKTKDGERRLYATKKEATASVKGLSAFDYEVEVVADVERWAVNLNELLAREQKRKRTLEFHLAALLKAFPTLLQSNAGLEAQKALDDKGEA